MKSWRDKAYKVIGTLCQEFYVQANRMKDGNYRKKHVPYSVPTLAERLIDCLNTDDEIGAKNIFVWEL